MIGIFSSTRDYCVNTWRGWNRFWFTPADPATLSLLRLLAGGVLFYTHLIWSFDLSAFLGTAGWLPAEMLRSDLHGGEWSAWSVFFWIEPTWLLWCVHLLALAVFFCLMIGLMSRTVAVLAFLFAVSYVQRISPGAFFDLDRINLMLAMYLMLGPCGARYSVDRLLRLRRGNQAVAQPTTSANLAIRLIQVHLCIFYLFAGLEKLGGENWQAGTAVWWAAANLEYQWIDMTWLARWPVLVALATHLTLFWQLFYCCLVWNRFTRPLVLWLAVLTSATVALATGLFSLGSAMIMANLAFLSPAMVRRWIDPLAGRVSMMLVGKQVE